MIKIEKQKTGISSKQPVSILKKRPPPQLSVQKQVKPSKRVPKTILEEMQNDESDDDAAALFWENDEDKEEKQVKQEQEQFQKIQQEQTQKQRRRLQQLLELIKKQNTQKGDKKSGTKKKGITINQELNVQYDLDKKWDSKIQNQKKGAFSEQQQSTLYTSICKYAVQNDLSLNDIQQQILYNVNPSKKQAMWTTICSVLPRRSINACFKFLKRKLDPRNHHGHWTEEEVQELKLLVDQHHTKWTLISKQLNRTPQNIKDKYRSIGEERSEQRNISFWKMQELITLIRSIQKDVNIRFLNKQYKNKITDMSLHDNYQIKERDARESKSRKRNSQYFLFHNLSTILTFINFNKLNAFLENPTVINWGSILKYIPTKSKDDCRNKWKQIISIAMTKLNYFTEAEDMKLVNEIERQNVQNQYEINFQKVNNEHTSKSNRSRWNVLKRFVSGRISKSVRDVIKELKKKTIVKREDNQLLPDSEENKILKMFMEMKKIQERVRGQGIKQQEQNE